MANPRIDNDVQKSKKYVRVVTTTTANEESRKTENIENWNLHIPVSGSVQGKQILGKQTLEIIQEKLELADYQKQKMVVASLIVEHEGLEEKSENPLVEELREKIFQDYTGTVICEELRPNPPVRGKYGYAFIPLKEGAAPQRCKPFNMHGERLEAYKKVTQDWWDHGFIERPTKGGCEWLSQGFVVPKNQTHFPGEEWWIKGEQIAKQESATTYYHP